MARIEGKPVWLEISTQRIAEAERFYTTFLGWNRGVAHVDPWGILTMFRNRKRPVGTSFLAQAPFQASRWNIFLAGDPDRIAQRIERLGGGVIAPPESATGWGRTTEVYDPMSHAFTVIALDAEDPPDPAGPGDLLCVELRAPDATNLADFYAALFQYEVTRMGEIAWLSSQGYPRILLRNDPLAPLHHPWIPWFRSASPAADEMRAVRYGAVRQLPSEDVPGIGVAAVLSDPCGAYFGLVKPTE